MHASHQSHPDVGILLGAVHAMISMQLSRQLQQAAFGRLSHVTAYYTTPHTPRPELPSGYARVSMQHSRQQRQATF